MRKMTGVLLLLMILILSGCGEKPVPLENPEMELFEVQYENEEFIVYIRSYIDPDLAYTMEAYSFGLDEETCLIGSFHRRNYIFEIEDEYYEIVEANKFGIISCDDLVEARVIGANEE